MWTTKPYASEMKNKRLINFGFKKYDDFKNEMESKNMKNKSENTKNEWKKVEFEIFKFENKGDSIEGELISKEVGMNFGNEVYKIRTKEGDKTVFSTVVLQSQMKSVNTGSFIKIIFTGTKVNEKKGQNPIKLFDVYFKEC